MDNANYSKPTQREIDRAETDLLITVSQVTGRKFAELAGWHESKISRMNWRDIATIFCIAKMAAECSPLGWAIQEAYKAVGIKKSPAATEDSEQISMNF
ncbi:regulatory protein [Pectobacterium brasiliense]|uniref:CII family transcriptional regulator n=1 Tax=Pectobacterium brasiliense TaxID=180957 RepID=UPI00057DD1B9|nr:CII family transcriptional regulator [Pectobacterium brasiliense]KHS76997.1 regulatory protein [Pectobacterium brasiliense]